MSYRLIEANMLNGKISDEDYEVVLNAPCIYADLPNGLDNEHYVIPKWIPVPDNATNRDVIEIMFNGFSAKKSWWDAPYKKGE